MVMHNVWGNNNNSHYSGSSGDGSTIKNNINSYVPFLKDFIRKNNVKTIVDLGCGDFVCGEYMYKDLDIVYTGYDTYKKIIEYNSMVHLPPKFTFVHLDFYTYKEKLIKSDLCILKDVLQHWRSECIYTFLDFIITNRLYKYILIINCCWSSHLAFQQAFDIRENGQFRTLSSHCLPLKRYNPVKLYQYDTKEVLLIQSDDNMENKP